MDHVQLLQPPEFPDASGRTVIVPDDVSRYLDVDHSRLAEAMGAGFKVKANEPNPFAAPRIIVERNNETLNHWLPIWLGNIPVCSPYVLDDFDVVLSTGKAKRDANASAAPCDAERKDIAAIISAGASLEKYLPFFKNWKGIIICGPTTASALLAHGVCPHYMVSVDSNRSTVAHLRMTPMLPFLKTKLLLAPTADEATVSFFKKPNRYWFKALIQGANGLNHPFNLFMSLTFPWIEAFIIQGGSMTNAAYLIPTLLGMGGVADVQKIFLFGSDMGYGTQENPVARAADWRWRGEENESAYKNWEDPELWQRNPVPDWRQRSLCDPAFAANGVFTDIGMLGYKRSLYTLWEIQSCRNWKERKPGDACLYNCSDGGILFELPQANGFEVIETQGACAALYDFDVVEETFKRYQNDSAIKEKQLGEAEQTAEERASGDRFQQGAFSKESP